MKLGRIWSDSMNFAVIGYPIEHSLSPKMHQAALDKIFPDSSYIRLSIAPENLKLGVESLRNLNFRGFNVTIPHKTSIMEFLDEIDSDAQEIGAVNTVVNVSGKLIGFNTDHLGFLHGLGDFLIENRDVTILGAGGAARAVYHAFKKNRARRITIGVRNLNRAKNFDSAEIFQFEDPEFVERLATTDLIVNTTPLGMSPNVDSMPPIDIEKMNSNAFVYDLIYTPELTKFLQESQKRGHRIANGVPMLVGQGAEAFRLWTGKIPDIDSMLDALLNQLRCKN